MPKILNTFFHEEKKIFYTGTYDPYLKKPGAKTQVQKNSSLKSNLGKAHSFYTRILGRTRILGGKCPHEVDNGFVFALIQTFHNKIWHPSNEYGWKELYYDGRFSNKINPSLLIVSLGIQTPILNDRDMKIERDKINDDLIQKGWTEVGARHLHGVNSGMVGNLHWGPKGPKIQNMKQGQIIHAVERMVIGGPRQNDKNFINQMYRDSMNQKLNS